MLCQRITSRSLSRIHRIVTDVRSCRFTAVRTQITQLPAVFPLSQHGSLFYNASRYSSSTSTETQSDKQPEPQSSEPEPQNSEPEPQNSEPDTQSSNPVQEVYRYSQIKTAGTITKVKIFQTVLVTAFVPYIFSGYLKGLVSYAALLSSIGIMTTATLMLYVVSNLVSKIICILKYNKETGEVYISHINFWGRRRDVVLDIANIIPISDSTENLTDTYIKVNTYDKSESFLIFIKDCNEETKKELLRIIG